MKKRWMALLFSGVLAVSTFAGCGTEIDKTAAVATGGGTEIPLGVANFAARLTQAQYDDFYVSYFGENVWRTDMYGYGTTTEYDTKASIMEGLYELYSLQNHMADYGVEITEADKAAISEAAAAFLNANSAEAIEAMGATKEIVEEYLTLLTIESRMYDAIITGADTNVSDEEANTSAYSYVYISKTSYTDEEGNTVTYTEEDLALLAQSVGAFAEAAKADGLETAAEAHGYTVSAGTYNADTTVAAEVAAALDAMTQEGAVADLVETDSAYYVLRMDAFTDEAATEENRQNIIADRQTELYVEVVDGYLAEAGWSLDEKLWDKVKFDNLFTLYPPSTETTEALEADSQTEAE